jgi:hypothetical protein
MMLAQQKPADRRNEDRRAAIGCRASPARKENLATAARRTLAYPNATISAIPCPHLRVRWARLDYGNPTVVPAGTTTSLTTTFTTPPKLSP